MYIESVESFRGGSRIRYTIPVPGLHIALANPNPFPVEVVLIIHNSGLICKHKIIDVGNEFGFKWYKGAPPEGVEVVRVDWFKISMARARGLRMTPALQPPSPSRYMTTECLKPC